MRDIHSIGQAFKIVSERTAKGRADIKSSDEKNNVEAMTADELLASQEFPSQKFLYFERCQDGYIEYNIPTNTKIRMVLDKIEFEIEQARAEIIKEVSELAWWLEKYPKTCNICKKKCFMFEQKDDLSITNVCYRCTLKRLVEGEKK